MSRLTIYIAKWKWCGLVSLTMVLLSLLPQMHLWLVRGHEWNGAYVSAHGDEPLYSAYLNALIDGRSRKNDPFGGRDDSANAPLPESIYSIQFVPAIVIALPARALGVSASTAFIFLIALAAMFASMAVFWLLNTVTANPGLAAAGTLFVLCLGGVFGSYGVFGTLVDIAYPVLPFLRRYEPTAVFPLFFIFNVLTWRALKHTNERKSIITALAAGLALVVLIFSYLYLWTAAAAWLGCIGALWFYLRPSDRTRTVRVVIPIGIITVAALAVYVYLLSHKAQSLEQQQIMTITHRPDLFRVQEIVGGVILGALVIGVWRNTIDRADPRAIYAASLGLLPFIVLNQQIITGRTIQVFHFEVFVVNYTNAVALLITFALSVKLLPKRLLIWMVVLSSLWGIIAMGLPARLLFVPVAIANDQRIPVLRRLNDLSSADNTIKELRAQGKTSNLVFSPSVALIALLPTWTSQGTLLDVTGVDCGSITREERKHFFYMHLYYARVDAAAFRQGLNGTPDRLADELSSVRSVVFGHARIFQALTPEFHPIQPDEIQREVQIYQAYIDSFSRDEALKRPITYAVIPVERNFDFTNLDRWYEREAGERVGDYVLYRVRLRD